MKVLVALACLLAGVLAQEPHPCSSPFLMTGAFSQSTQNEKLWTYGKYLYDALGERIRLIEMRTEGNKTFPYDLLLLYKQAVMYEINDQDRTCKKKPLKVAFQPIGIPKDATLLGQAIVGSSSGPGQGLLVNTWTGQFTWADMYLMTVTEFGCIPVTSTYHTKPYGWMVVSYFNNVIGIENPDLLNPPAFCPGLDMEVDSDEEPVDFFSIFNLP